MSFKVTWKLHTLCILLSYVICFAMRDLITNICIDLYIGNKTLNITNNTIIDFMLFILIMFVPIAIIHELIHGSTYRMFGGKVRYGFKGIYAFSQETSGIVLHRTKFLIVLLAPVITISVITLFVPGKIAVIFFLLNLLGSTGDIIMAFYLVKSNSKSYIVDKEYGFDIVDISKLVE